MTRYRNDPNAISNKINTWLAGIGPRGGSFADVDGVTHDKVTNRFLVQEFKWPHEKLNWGQALLLLGFALLPGVTVWAVRIMRDETIMLCEIRGKASATKIITVPEYQEKFRQWWYPGTPPKPAPTTPETMTSDMLRW